MSRKDSQDAVSDPAMSRVRSSSSSDTFDCADFLWPLESRDNSSPINRARGPRENVSSLMQATSNMEFKFPINDYRGEQGEHF